MAWYYEGGTGAVGPVSEAEIKQLIAAGTINLRTLVWTSEFGTLWKPLAETSLAPPPDQSALPEPPPLPAKSGNGESDEGLAREFLVSGLTQSLIGKSKDHYLAKWTALLERTNYNPLTVTRQRSWNWPAFFIPGSWLFYRKLYVLGSLVVAAQLASIFFGKYGSAVPFVLGIVAALYGNAWYLDATYRKWRKLRTIADPALAADAAKAQGGTSLVPAIGAVALVVAVAVLSEGPDIFSSNMSCSSTDAQEVVQRIAREQISKDSYMVFVVDSQATKISLDAIRTQTSGDSKLNCAARISYAIAFKGKGEAVETIRPALEQALNRDITYTVEKTDKGDQLYVTVFGLNN